MSSFISIIPPVSLAIFEPLPIVEGQDINKAKALFKTLHSIVGKYAGSGSSIDKDSLVKQVRCYILDKKHRNKKQEGFNLQTLIVVFIRMYWYTIESSKISQWFLLLLAAVKKYPKSVWTTDNTRRSCSSTLFTQL